jgi:hypothetical protein
MMNYVLCGQKTMNMSKKKNSIQHQLNLYGYTIFMVLGNIGNLFIVLIFSRQHQNACSIYILN